MKKTISVVSAWMLLMNSFVMGGTTGKIAGKVVDARTKQPLPGANVVIKEIQIGASAGSDAAYFLLNVPPGSYSVMASFLGYKGVTFREVKVSIDQTTTLDFALEETVIEAEEIVIVAERPVVEKDLTASKQRVTASELERSWIRNVGDEIKTLSGVNINGGVRGTFGKDIVYFVDGQELRDMGSNVNYTGISTLAIQELEVLTGGFNAEFGQAHGSVVNIVTKSAKDKIRGSIQYKIRPVGKYHWGREIYSENNYEWAVMATRDYWDPNSTYLDWDGQRKLGHDGGPFFATRTPEERLAAWKRWISGELSDRLNVRDLLYGYTDRNQWMIDGILYGPITSDLGFLVSGKWIRGVPKFPSFLKENPEWNFMGKLDYTVSSSARIDVAFMHGGFDNSGLSRSSYYTSEDGLFGGSRAEAGFISSYDRLKLWPFGTSHLSYRSPEYQRMYSGHVKLTYSVDPSTFFELSLSHLQMTNKEDNRSIIPFEWYEDLRLPELVPQNNLFLPISAETNKGQYLKRHQWTRSNSIRADLMSQVHENHQVKMGASFSYQYFKKVTHWGWEQHLQLDDAYKPGNAFYPYEGAAYFQDKYESPGLILNIGVRLDFFNANKKVSNSVWDPLRINQLSPGNVQPYLISMAEGSPYAAKTKTHVAISPRIGISHPITENAVLHFMYGHFNQRPSWKMIGTNSSVLSRNGFPAELKPDGDTFPPDWPVDYRPWDYYGNPGLGYEKTIQYEIGVDQYIADLFRLDVTLYYKDGKGLTSVGQMTAGRNAVADYGTDASGHATHLFPDPPQGSGVAPTGDFFIYTNGGYLDSRGLEITLSTRFRDFANVQLAYDLSYTYTNRYGPSILFREFPDGTRTGQDRYFGLSNLDRGIAGNRNDRWNPNNTLKLMINANTPKEFGPLVGPLYPLGDWYVATYTVWSSGPKFTYHSPGDLSTEVDNRTWDGRWETNMRLAKRIASFMGTTLEFTVDVYNLFNQKYLRPLTGQALQDYMENGILPKHPVTKETLEWEIYDFNLMPREIILGIKAEF